MARFVTGSAEGQGGFCQVLKGHVSSWTRRPFTLLQSQLVCGTLSGPEHSVWMSMIYLESFLVCQAEWRVPPL